MTREEAIERVRVILDRRTDPITRQVYAPAFIVDVLVALGLLKVEDDRH